MTRWTRLVLVVFGLAAVATPVLGQTTTTYYLHNEDSGELCCPSALKTIGPDAAAVVIQSGDLKNQTGTGILRRFQTLSGTPSLNGMIAANTTISFSFYMRKTASTSGTGVIAPYVIVGITAGTAVFIDKTLCSGTGPVLGTTLQLVEFSCQTGSEPITWLATDRVRVHVGYSISTSPTKSVKVELGFEGNTTPVYNSRAVVPNPVPPPPPSITALKPESGPVNWPVTIQGSNFGSTTGSVKFFNNKPASINSWSTGSIEVTVPSGAEDGPVTVTTSAGTSPGVTFDVIPPPALSSISPSSAHRNDTVTITGTNFLATQGNSTVTFGTSTASPTSWNNTTIVTPVPADANTGNVVVTVSGQPSNALPFMVIIPGSLGGTITRTSGGTALAGATVQAVLTGIVKGSAISAANGTYSIASLDPGTYDVRITATGFSSELRQGVAITSSSTTTVDVAMSVPGGVSGKITQIDGTTPIVGAAVTVYSGPFQKGSATTNGTGDYTSQALHPGAYTIQAANVGYQTKEQGTVVAENATTTVNLSLDNAVSGPVLYSYDALGRLIQVTDPSGDAAIYRYDAVGNITAIERPTSGGVSISAITPTNGPVGSTVTIYGTGFSSTPVQNTAAFGCGPSCTVNATITSATPTRLALTVPATAVTGTIGVTTPGGSASSPTFTVTAAGAAPTLTGFTPTLIATGDTLNVTGTNFDTTPANDRLTTNVAVAQVTSATLTSLQATVPITTTGRVSIATQHGSATSTDYLWVAPPGYSVSQVESTGVLSLGTATPVAVNDASKIAMRAFEGVQGHRVSATLAPGTGSGEMSLYKVYGDRHKIGFGTGTGFLEPVFLTATGTYTFVLAPQSPGSRTVTLHDVPPDVSDALVPGTGLAVSLLTPGQDARLPFPGTAAHRISVKTDSSTSIASGTIRVLRPDGAQIGSVGFIGNSTGFLEPKLLPVTGTYTVWIDSSFANTGDTIVTAYDVPADTTGSVTINGNPVPVNLGTPGQNGSLTFTGTQNQQVTVHVTGNTIGSVTVKLLSSDGQTVLTQTLQSGANFDLLPAPLPTVGTATYTITINPSSANAGTLNISVTAS